MQSVKEVWYEKRMIEQAGAETMDEMKDVYYNVENGGTCFCI